MDATQIASNPWTTRIHKNKTNEKLKRLANVSVNIQKTIKQG
jgi:hypothetical protein